MLSRVADSIFWLARYMERTNGMLRVLRTNYISSQDEVKDFSWQVLLRNYSDASAAKIKTIGNHSVKVLEHFRVLAYYGTSPVTASDPQLRIANLERELHWADLKIQSLLEEMRQLRIKF